MVQRLPGPFLGRSQDVPSPWLRLCLLVKEFRTDMDIEAMPPGPIAPVLGLRQALAG